MTKLISSLSFIIIRCILLSHNKAIKQCIFFSFEHSVSLVNTSKTIAIRNVNLVIQQPKVCYSLKFNSKNFHIPYIVENLSLLTALMCEILGFSYKRISFVSLNFMILDWKNFEATQHLLSNGKSTSLICTSLRIFDLSKTILHYYVWKSKFMKAERNTGTKDFFYSFRFVVVPVWLKLLALTGWKITVIVFS